MSLIISEQGEKQTSKAEEIGIVQVKQQQPEQYQQEDGDSFNCISDDDDEDSDVEESDNEANQLLENSLKELVIIEDAGKFIFASGEEKSSPRSESTLNKTKPAFDSKNNLNDQNRTKNDAQKEQNSNLASEKSPKNYDVKFTYANKSKLLHSFNKMMLKVNSSENQDYTALPSFTEYVQQNAQQLLSANNNFQDNNNNKKSKHLMKDFSKSTGRWTKEEHLRFLQAIKIHGREWKKVEQYVKTRSSTQARSHAQKFFVKLQKKGVSVESFIEKLNQNEDMKEMIENDSDYAEEDSFGASVAIQYNKKEINKMRRKSDLHPVGGNNKLLDQIDKIVPQESFKQQRSQHISNKANCESPEEAAAKSLVVVSEFSFPQILTTDDSVQDQKRRFKSQAADSLMNENYSENHVVFKKVKDVPNKTTTSLLPQATIELMDAANCSILPQNLQERKEINKQAGPFVVGQKRKHHQLDNVEDRIENEGQSHQILNSDQQFTQTELPTKRQKLQTNIKIEVDEIKFGQIEQEKEEQTVPNDTQMKTNKGVEQVQQVHLSLVEVQEQETETINVQPTFSLTPRLQAKVSWDSPIAAPKSPFFKSVIDLDYDLMGLSQRFSLD